MLYIFKKEKKKVNDQVTVNTIGNIEKIFKDSKWEESGGGIFFHSFVNIPHIKC